MYIRMNRIQFIILHTVLPNIHCLLPVPIAWAKLPGPWAMYASSPPALSPSSQEDQNESHRHPRESSISQNYIYVNYIYASSRSTALRRPASTSSYHFISSYNHTITSSSYHHIIISSYRHIVISSHSPSHHHIVISLYHI